MRQKMIRSYDSVGRYIGVPGSSDCAGGGGRDAERQGRATDGDSAAPHGGGGVGRPRRARAPRRPGGEELPPDHQPGRHPRGAGARPPGPAAPDGLAGQRRCGHGERRAAAERGVRHEGGRGPHHGEQPVMSLPPALQAAALTSWLCVGVQERRVPRWQGIKGRRDLVPERIPINNDASKYSTCHHHVIVAVSSAPNPSA